MQQRVELRIGSLILLLASTHMSHVRECNRKDFDPKVAGSIQTQSTSLFFSQQSSLIQVYISKIEDSQS